MKHFAVFRHYTIKVGGVIFSAPDFSKKQIVFVLFSEGEKLAFSNDNLIVKDRNGKIKFQCTCYRLFIVFGVGHTSITSALIQKSRKFGFFIALMTPDFKLYSLIGDAKDGNTMLHRKQYKYEGLDIAKHIVINKMLNQKQKLKEIRHKNEYVKEADFLVLNNQYKLKWSEASRYVSILMKPIMDNKESIFAYIQAYYRAFMKELPANEFPTFEVGDN